MSGIEWCGVVLVTALLALSLAPFAMTLLK
jgi:hypothetical protein